jgi:hypothetical protein
MEMKMRYLPLALSLMFSPVIAAHAQISVAIGLPGVNIGIDMPSYPQMVQVPGYPVYYDPGARSNYFFYDGAYWVYQRDNWYASTWYNGPWQEVSPGYVPLFVLRIPVRYYRQPPSYFRGWSADAPPRWGDHWGQGWSSQRQGWDRWNRNAVPTAAPLPTYQRRYSGTRYPRTVMQQASIRTQDYRYQPREAVTRQIQQRSPTKSRGVGQTQQRANAQQSERRAQTLQRTQMQQRANAQQSEKRAQAEQTQKVQRTQSRQRAQAQQTQKRVQAEQAQTLQRSQTQQREQARQTDQRAQAEQAQKVQLTQSQQRAQAQQTQKRAQPEQAQTLRRSQSQQREQARQTDQRAQAQQAQRSKAQKTRPAKVAPKNKDRKAQDADHDNGGG